MRRQKKGYVLKKIEIILRIFTFKNSHRHLLTKTNFFLNYCIKQFQLPDKHVAYLIFCLFFFIFNGLLYLKVPEFFMKHPV